MPSLKIPGYGLTTPGPIVIGTDPGVGQLIRLTHDGFYNSEALSGIYMRAGVGKAALMLGCDETHQLSFIQSLTASSSFAGRPLALQPNAGAVTVGTDPGGTDLLRVGGPARVSQLAVGNNLAVRSGVTYPGAGVDVAVSGTVANNATIAIGDGSSNGLVLIVTNQVEAAIVQLRGSLPGVVIAQAITGTWGAAVGGANNFNVYWDAGTTTYRIENRTGGNRAFYIQRIGSFPAI